MRRLSLLIVQIFILSIFSFQSDASVLRKVYDSFGPDRGLDGGPVNVIYRNGYDHLWVGAGDSVGMMTNEGFRMFSPEAGEVLHILQDGVDNVWVLAEDALCLFDVSTGTFKRHDIAATAGFVLEDRCIFVAGDRIYGYDYKSGKLSEVLSFSSQGDYKVSEIFSWSDGSLLLTDMDKGALAYNPDVDSVSKCPFVPAGCDAVFADSRGRLWYSETGHGLRCLDQTGRLVGEYTTSNSDIPSDVIFKIGESQGRIVALTDEGLCTLMPDHTGEMSIESQKAGDFFSFPTTSVSSMFCDPDGSIWFGRPKGGVFEDFPVQIESNATSFCNASSLNCLYRPAGQKKVWIGTEGSGILVFDPLTTGTSGRLKAIPGTDGLNVVSMAGFSDEEILVSCAGRGLMLMNRNSGASRHFETGNLILDGYGKDGAAQAYDICAGPQGSVMIMSDTDMFRFFPSGRRVSEVRLPESAVGKGGLHACFPGEPGLFYWNSHSLFEYDVLSNALVEVIRFEDEINITSVSTYNGNTVWLGSGKGLVSLNRSTRKYEIIPLPFDCSIESVLCSNAGRVWVGTDNGLFFYDTSTGEFTSIDESDGLAFNNYSEKAKLFAEDDNEVYMGGLNGFARIDSNISFTGPAAPQIVLEGISVNGERVPSPYGCKIYALGSEVTVDVFVRESKLLRDKKYRYKITGPGSFDKEIVGDKPSFSVSGLPAGRYRVMASCILKSGSWTDYAQVAEFRVAQKWYKSIWLCIALVALLLVATAYMVSRFLKAHTKDTHQSYQSRTNEERLNFLVNLSHELRTPLTLTTGPLEKVLESMSPQDSNFKRLSGVVKQTKKMKTLLDTVLTASKVENGGAGQSLNLTYQSFNNWVKHVVADFNEEAQARNINLSAEYDNKIGMVDFDEEKCQIVLSNILMNALAHNPDNSEIQVWTETHPERAAVRVSVSDRGPGIKDEDLSEIFNRFYQSTEDNHGYGIGLAYSKQIMYNMHGVICAYNNSHGGATFYFEIPTTLVEQPAAPVVVPLPEVRPKETVVETAPEVQKPVIRPEAPAHMPVTTHVPPSVNQSSLLFEDPRNIPDLVIDLKNANLLIVEDDISLRNYLKDELSGSLKNVFVAGNGVEAIKVLNSEPVNIVVSDVMMPEMDGFTLCRYIKTTVSVSHIPVILLTARSDDNSRLLGYKNGADDYITKPFDLDNLEDSIQRLFFSRVAIRQRFTGSAPMPSAEETTFSSADESFLQKFAKIVADNISDPNLDSKFLVDNMGMSRTVLFNKVKQLTGLNLQNYVNKSRMEHVIHLMSTTNMSLAEIAENSGFSSPRYFSTSFKNYTGVTPTQYKKDHR